MAHHVTRGWARPRRLRRALRLVRLVGGVFAVSLQQQLAHRTDLAVQLALTGLGAAGALGALGAVYARVDRLAGWSAGEALVLLGAFTAVGAVLQAFVEPNLRWFADQVKQGAADDALLTPAPVLFTATFGACDPLALTGVATGAAYAVAGILVLGPDAARVTPASALAAGLLLVVGVVVAWAARLVLAGAAFWAPGLDLTTVYAGLWQLGRYPLDVYAPWVRGLLTWVVPVAFVSTLPARALTRGADPVVLLGGVAAAAGSVAVAAAVWRAGLRRYTSAMS